MTASANCASSNGKSLHGNVDIRDVTGKMYVLHAKDQLRA